MTVPRSEQLRGAHLRGQLAVRAGRKVDDCPYGEDHPDQMLRTLWRLGFRHELEHGPRQPLARAKWIARKLWDGDGS